jgi:hypothetical protein
MNLDDVFARKTRQHSIALQNSPPCAKELYDWLLRQAPAGKPADIYLEDFQAEQSGRLHGKGYQLRWIKDCLKHLIELELVEVAYKISSKVFKLITWHPQQRNAKIPQSSAQNLQANARSQASNADSLDPLYRERRETTDKPTHHPVSTDERERAIGTSQISKTPEIDPKAKETIETAGFQFNSTLASIVRSKSLEIILAAVEAAKQYHQRLQTKNKPLRRQPEAILAAAIQEEWQPQRGEQGTVIPPEFDEWFRLAQATKLVSMTSAQSDLTGHSPGVLCVYSVSGEWLTYDEMRRLHPLAEIKEIAKKQQEMVFVPSPRLSIKPSQC